MHCLDSVISASSVDSFRHQLKISDLSAVSTSVDLEVIRLRNDLYCVGWGVKLY